MPTTMPRSLAALAALVAFAALLGTAAPALAVDPLVLATATPANRAVVPPTPTGGIPWQITAPAVPPDANVSVTVSTTPATGPDGVTLGTADRVDLFFLSASPDAPGVYSGLSDPGPNAWSAVAATYYWQVVATWTDASGVFHSAASTVLRIVIGTPPPPSPVAPPASAGQASRTTLAMSLLDATYYVRTVIRRHTNRPPVKLHYGCTRLSSRSFRCRPSWRDSRNTYSATATFSHERADGRIVARGTISGRRASRRCAQTRTVKSCARPFRWRVATAARPVARAVAP
jgi:hypothetical protein